MNSSCVVRGSLNVWRILNKYVQIEPKTGLDKSRWLKIIIMIIIIINKRL